MNQKMIVTVLTTVVLTMAVTVAVKKFAPSIGVLL